MAIYRLKCVMRFTDGRSGTAFDTTEIEAATNEEAIRQAKDYQRTPPDMEFSAAVLTDEAGRVVWTLTAPS